MAGARDHTELDVWQLSDEVRRRVDEITAHGRFDRRPTLRDQLRESSDSPCPNIAEGFGRFQPRDFARFLRIARGSLVETIDHLHRAAELNLITTRERDETTSFARRACRALSALINYLTHPSTRPPDPPSPRHRTKGTRPEPGTGP
jgi:four helix bundle protein